MKLYNPEEAMVQARLAAAAPVYADVVSGSPAYPQMIRKEPGRTARYSRRQWKVMVSTFKERVK